MSIAVVVDERASEQALAAVAGAATRIGADVFRHPPGGGVAAIRAAASANDAVAVVAADAVLAVDAFASLRRLLSRGALLVGGRAVVGEEQRFGAMLARPRWGPDAVEIVPIQAPLGQALAEHIRGPIDVPQRGAFVVSSALASALPDVADGIAFLALALCALGRAATVCEPNLSFVAADDPDDVVRLAPRLLRAARIDLGPDALHRDPPAIRRRLIGREVRAGGDVRGYERRPLPDVVVLVVGADAAASAAAGQLRRSGVAREVHACAEADGARLRSLLARTGDRYLLVVPASGSIPDRDTVATLAEAVESSGRAAIALDGDVDAFDLALFHQARISDPAAFGDGSVRDVVRSAVAVLPRRRRYAVAAGGVPIGAGNPGPISPPRRVDAIMLAASRPVLSRQSLEALRENSIDGSTTVISPAGFVGVKTVVGAHPDVRYLIDPADPQLTGTLNASIARAEAEAIFLVRDDVNIPPNLVDRLRAAFARMPELAIAVPRVGGPDRPESISEVDYRDLQSMRGFAARLAVSHARDATLLDAATVPVMMIARRAFEIVGGFDPAYGFSRFGIEEFSRRVRSANLVVACIDDAFAHLHLAGESQSLLGELDGSPALRERLTARERDRDGFDPPRDRIEPSAAAGPVTSSRIALRVLAAVRDERELTAALPSIADFAARFTVDDPLEIVLALDGPLRVAAAVAAVREVLSRSAVPLERTVNVRIEQDDDPAQWIEPDVRTMRFSSCERPSLAGLDSIEAQGAAQLLNEVAL